MSGSGARSSVKWIILIATILLIGNILVMWKLVRDTRVKTQADYTFFQNDLFQHGIFVSKTIRTLHQIIDTGREELDFVYLRRKLDVYTRAILGHQSINLQIYSRIIQLLPDDDPLALRERIERVTPALSMHIDYISRLNRQIGASASSHEIKALISQGEDRLRDFLNLMNGVINLHSQIESSFFKMLKDNNAESIEKLSHSLILLFFLIVFTVALLSIYLVEQNRTRRILRKHNDELEGRVRERTREFRAANRRLTGEIRERQQKEKELKVKDAAIEHSLNGFDIVDEDGRFIYVNKAYMKMWGYERKDEIIGKSPADHFADPGMPEKIIRALKENGEFEVELKARRKDGSFFYVLMYATLAIDHTGREIYPTASIDITEKKELEAKLLQAQKMESVGNLAGGIAHDFNNILASIIGFTELALDDAPAETDLRDHLLEVYAGGKRARDLVCQILTFARQSGETKKPIQVDTVVEDALKLVRSSVSSTIDIRQDIVSGSMIMGNTTQVHQIVLNLCTNAAQSMHAGGGVLSVGLDDVTIEKSHKLAAGGLEPGDYVRLVVSDTGCGIPADTIDSIFEPYFTTKGIGEGTGMGLAVVHGIVEKSGGKIFVESEWGSGTVFEVYLPVTKKRGGRRSVQFQELPGGTERILFVDDEASIVKMGGRNLEGLGYAVETSTSSLEALERFKSKPEAFDLVISDMTMPQMTGDLLAVELMKIRPDIPVVLCTGYSNKITEAAADAIGIKAFAYKPIVKADIAKTVRKVLDEAGS